MGKKYDNLIENVADWDNLLLAYKKARRGKRHVDEIKQFELDLWLHLGNIQWRLLHGSYSIDKYRSFVVFEPKKREILAAPFGDRVVQHALLNVLEPIWEKQMISDAFACRPGKGVHAGANRIQRWLRDKSKNQPIETIWIVKTDFSGYFKNIRHADLKRVIRRKIVCDKTLMVLDAIIDSTPNGVGIPVGNLTSQWFANLLGNEIDQFVKRELCVKSYLRYMDDCLAMFDTRIAADLFLGCFERKAKHYGLWFSKISVHRASQGINMLGYRIWTTHRLLRKRAIIKFRRDIHKPDINAEVRRKSFVAHAKHADTWRLRNKLFNENFTI